MTIKTPEEIEIMAEGGKRLGAVLKALQGAAKIGVATIDLDRMAHKLIVESGAKPAFLHYRPHGAKKAYPFTLCASVNDVVVHGQPSGYVLRNGDVLKLDLGLRYGGFYLDAAITVPLGKVSKDVERLIAATDEALQAAIGVAKIGQTLGDIGFAVEKTVKKAKCSVVDGLTGHGIGRELHEDPPVFNFGKKGEGEDLVEGMVVAIEPMVALGRANIKQLADESYGTADGSLAAHFEHTVAITKGGPRVLTVVQ